MADAHPTVIDVPDQSGVQLNAADDRRQIRSVCPGVSGFA